MVFAVLCLTIFSVLSFTTGISDLKLSQRVSESVADYYAAEYKAEEMVLQIAEQYRKDGDIDSLLKEYGSKSRPGSQDCDISFTVVVDTRRILLVEMTIDGGGNIKVTRWNILPSADWNPDNSMYVWSGEN